METDTDNYNKDQVNFMALEVNSHTSLTNNAMTSCKYRTTWHQMSNMMRVVKITIGLFDMTVKITSQFYDYLWLTSFYAEFQALIVQYIFIQ